MEQTGCNIYEKTALCGASDGSLHPGGLELTEKSLAAAALAEGAAILDLGCGRGQTVAWLLSKGYRAEGLDASAVLIAAGQGQGLPVTVGKSDSLPYKDRSFEAVLLECTLSVFGPRRETLGEINRVLKPGGALVVSDFYLLPHSKDQKLTLSLITCLDGILTRELLTEELAEQGFILVNFTDANQAYKKLLFDIIMEHGSLDLFWRRIFNCGDDNCRDGLRGNKLSYFYGVWQKEPRS